MSVLSGKAKYLAVVLNAVAIFAVNTPLSAQEFDRGEELYENHCKECHEGAAHLRPASRIATMGDIRNQVTSWSIHSNLDWSSEDVEDVADYLNKTFYHLTDRP